MPARLRQHFIDWSRPALPAAVDFLIANFRVRQTLALDNVLLVVPGRAAERRLEELLVIAAEHQGLVLFPPRIVTIGRLPELLYHPQKPFADALTQQLTWARVLKQLPPTTLAEIVRQPPAETDWLAWLALGEMLSAVHRELAADRLNFRDVEQHVQTLGIERERGRWRSLADAQEAYLLQLDELELWDKQTARLVAITQQEFQTDRHIVLIGLVELNQSQRDMLKQVAEQVTTLTFCTPTNRHQFDEFGCLKPELWLKTTFPQIGHQSLVVDRPDSQADAVVHCIEALDGRFAVNDIVVSVPDERVVPYLKQRLTDRGVPVRHAAGTLTAHTPLGRLLRRLAQFIERERFEDFAALVRHPDLDRWLIRALGPGDWLTALDDKFNATLPDQVPIDAWINEAEATGSERLADEPPVEDTFPTTEESQPGVARNLLPVADVETVSPGGNPDEHPACAQPAQTPLIRALSLLREWVQPLKGRARRLEEWVPLIREAVTAVLTNEVFDLDQTEDQRRVSALNQLRSALETLLTQPAQLMPEVSGADALRLVLRLLESSTIPDPHEAATLELQGWLDVRMDDARAVIVTGFNEGFVPASRNADVFLPNELRRRLKLEDNDRRYARDAYALSTLLASKDVVRLIAGRRTSQNDPLIPSRLLLAVEDDQLPERVEQVFGASTAQANAPHAAGAEQQSGSSALRSGVPQTILPVPAPGKLLRPVRSMRVTEFGDYLRCPYRYYLKHRLKLRSAETTANELPAVSFGNILHEVLERFARSPAETVHSTDASEISAFLGRTLDEVKKEWFHNAARAAIPIQLEFARLRLEAFAQWQAGWRANGWQIAYVEHQPDDAAILDVDGEPMRLRGRIDRIDFRESSTGYEVAVLDYKTGDRASEPDKRHRPQGEWTDLQLPLYRYLLQNLPKLPKQSTTHLGYIVLPQDLDQTGERLAEWTESELAEADEVAREIVRNVRHCRFGMNTAVDVSRYFPEFSRICQDDLYAAFINEAEDSVDESP